MKKIKVIIYVLAALLAGHGQEASAFDLEVKKGSTDGLILLRLKNNGTEAMKAIRIEAQTSQELETAAHKNMVESVKLAMPAWVDARIETYLKSMNDPINGPLYYKWWKEDMGEMIGQLKFGDFFAMPESLDPGQEAWGAVFMAQQGKVRVHYKSLTAELASEKEIADAGALGQAEWGAEQIAHWRRLATAHPLHRALEEEIGALDQHIETMKRMNEIAHARMKALQQRLKELQPDSEAYKSLNEKINGTVLWDLTQLKYGLNRLHAEKEWRRMKQSCVRKAIGSFIAKALAADDSLSDKIEQADP